MKTKLGTARMNKYLRHEVSPTADAVGRKVAALVHPDNLKECPCCVVHGMSLALAGYAASLIHAEPKHRETVLNRLVDLIEAIESVEPVERETETVQ